MIVADLKKTIDTSIFNDKSDLIIGGASGFGALTASQFACNEETVTTMYYAFDRLDQPA